jgi:hypothetical protein
VGSARLPSCFADNILTQKIQIGLFLAVENKLRKQKSCHERHG